jgi:hypothetical protein
LGRKRRICSDQPLFLSEEANVPGLTLASSSSPHPQCTKPILDVLYPRKYVTQSTNSSQAISNPRRTRHCSQLSTTHPAAPDRQFGFSLGPYFLSADGLRPILDLNFPQNSAVLIFLVYWCWKYGADISSHVSNMSCCRNQLASVPISWLITFSDLVYIKVRYGRNVKEILE